jgi:hypothetical protein
MKYDRQILAFPQRLKTKSKSASNEPAKVRIFIFIHGRSY